MSSDRALLPVSAALLVAVLAGAASACTSDDEDTGGDTAPRDAGDAGITRADATSDDADVDGGVDDAAIDGGSVDGGRVLTLPPVDGRLDYQLGGDYPPPEGITIVARDRRALPAGRYDVCYVNGFQIQPDEVDFWTENHPELMLRDGSGELVIDPDWNEILVDTRTPEKRAAVAAIVGDWIRGCAAMGYDAVEIDNLDTYSRSGGLVREDDNVATMRAFADVAHAEGLAIGQKNSAELVPRRDELGTDFAVVEECNRYEECDVFTTGYGDAVLIIEYRRQDFDTGCRDYPGLPIVLRDLDLVTPGDPGYVFDDC